MILGFGWSDAHQSPSITESRPPSALRALTVFPLLSPLIGSNGGARNPITTLTREGTQRGKMAPGEGGGGRGRGRVEQAVQYRQYSTE